MSWPFATTSISSLWSRGVSTPPPPLQREAPPMVLESYESSENSCSIFDDPSELAWRGAQGGAIYEGHVWRHESIVRQTYMDRVSALDVTDRAGRSAIRTEMRNASTSQGRALAEWMRPSGQQARVGGRANISNVRVNRGVRIAGAAGRGLLVAGAAISTYNIVTAPEGERDRAIAQEAGAWTGALAFGAAGAKGGALVGSFFGPVGTLVGAFVGGVGGGIGGAIAGSKAADNVFNWLSP